MIRFWCLFYFFALCSARIHHLPLELDDRTFIPLSTFGFLEGGTLEVHITNFTFKVEPDGNESSQNFENLIGFTLDKTLSDAATTYLDSRMDSTCSLDHKLLERNREGIVQFVVDFDQKRLNSSCSETVNGLQISETRQRNFERGKKTALGKSLEDTSLLRADNKKKDGSAGPGPSLSRSHRDVSDVTDAVKPEGLAEETKEGRCETSLPIAFVEGEYSFQFIVRIPSEFEQGLYNLNFHHCVVDRNRVTPLSFMVEIVEMNGDNYLSAGEIPLPKLYFSASFCYFVALGIWIACIMRSGKQEVYKIHYVMALLVALKAMSLALHGMNYTYIKRDGYHIEAWAVLYYITHLLKGAVLFITILLIGTGWAFVKHILSDRDKKLFMFIIPVQVLANVAYIITEESEQGNVGHVTWSEVFILLDLVCCGAILFPVVWSIKHLQEASQTDGKAAINLEKLKLFRQFYIMVVCYIYFTRIIVYLLKITVPFQYTWLDELFFEAATLTFFVFTGYNFRPAPNNPYFLMAKDDEENFELDEVLTETGHTENVTHLSRHKSKSKDGGRPEETESLVLNAEDSHEYD